MCMWQIKFDLICSVYHKCRHIVYKRHRIEWNVCQCVCCVCISSPCTCWLVIRYCMAERRVLEVVSVPAMNRSSSRDTIWASLNVEPPSAVWNTQTHTRTQTPKASTFNSAFHPAPSCKVRPPLLPAQWKCLSRSQKSFQRLKMGPDASLIGKWDSG